MSNPPALPAPTHAFDLFAQCPPGLEPLLLRELEGLGIRGTSMVGGVRWTGGWDTLMRANLHLRVASRVLVEVGRFRVRALGELERKAALLPWDRVLAQGPQGIRFRISASRSRLYHEGAIEERLRMASGIGPAEEPREPGDEGPLVVVRVHRDELVLRLDTSGEHLHRRGFRLHVGGAPLRETLAAALLLARPEILEGPLLDPFCGAGTVVLEAALLARKIPPGLARASREPRDYAFLQWPDLPRPLWEAEVERARAGILERAPFPLLASDRDAGMIEATRTNAEAAGLERDLALAQATLSQAPRPQSTPGWVVTNPPFGGRLGSRKALKGLYRALGESFRGEGRLRGWGLLLLSGDPVLDQTTGLPFETLLTTSHGGLRVRAQCYAPEARASDPADLPANLPVAQAQAKL